MAAVAGTPTATSSWVDDSTDQTTSYALDSGANKIVVVLHTKAFTNRTVTSVTWNGSALTSAGADDDGNRTRTEIFYLDSPATGTHNLVIDLAGTCTGVAVIYGVSSGASGAPETSAAWSIDGTSPDSVTLTGTSASSLIIGGVYFSSFSGSGIASSNSTRTSTSLNADGSYRAGSGTVSMDRTWTGSLFEATGFAISIADGGGGGGGGNYPYRHIVFGSAVQRAGNY